MNCFVKTKVLILSTAISIIATAGFTGCKKNTDALPFGFNTPPDLTTRVKSSVSGFVTSENDGAVNLATVQVGTVAVTTDKYGYFEVNNVDVVKNAAVVSVSKAGYFKGIKTFIAEAGKSAFFRIKLIPKTIAGNINSSTGGIITLPNGLSISLPANAVVNASGSVAYTGTVNITAHWINPTAADLPNTMPGDLRGLNTAGNLQLLTTYGMAAVELTGSGGELLQIASGKKATLSFPIPASLLSSAPATIPLWYFDEAKGLWKEEGVATKTGSNYVGQVSHFSFWNCDVSGNFVQFDCNVKNSNGQPIPNTYLKISVVNNPGNWRHGYSNQSGYVSGSVPANEQLLLEVFSSHLCSTPSYSQLFSSGSTNVSLGDIIVSSSATISGTVTTCANLPVTNGNIILQTSNLLNRYPISNNGTYNFSLLPCGTNSYTITLIGEDLASAQQSFPSSFTINPGTNSVPNIQACGTGIQEFVVFTVNGITRSYFSPVDFISHTLNTYNNPNPVISNFVRAFETGQNVFTELFFAHSNITQGSNQELFRFNTLWINDQLTIQNSPILVNITEYGPIGQFIAGNFSGTFVGNPPNNNIYNISCSFRVRRTL